MIRAIRFARALAFAGTGAATACSSTPSSENETPDTLLPDTRLADSGTSAKDSAIPDASPVDSASARDAANDGETETNGETGGGVGHCYTADDGQILCAEGQMCTFAGRILDCVDTPPSPIDEGADAAVQSCGLVSCALNGACFCANDKTSFCVCDYGAGPLPPPELPTSSMKRPRAKRTKRRSRSSSPRRGGTSLA